MVMSETVTVGFARAKNGFLFTGADGSGHSTLRQRMRRDQ
jgi:hypothetical protein